MTVASTTNSVSYTGNAAATNFAFSFLMPTGDEVVTLYEIATGIEGAALNASLYTVNGADDPNGGSIDYPLVGSPLAATHKINIKRVVALEQTLNLTTQSAYNPAELEAQLDKIVMGLVQVDEEVSRAIKVTTGSGDDPDTLQATLISLGADATASAAAASASEVAAAASAAAAAADAIDTAADAVSTAADAAATAIDAAATAADVVLTAADVVTTSGVVAAASASASAADASAVAAAASEAGVAADASAADASATAAAASALAASDDADATALDAAATAADAISTAADAVSTAADAALTAADVVTTSGVVASATAQADAAAVSAAAALVSEGNSGADAIATAADAVSTAADAASTAADVITTGANVTAAGVAQTAAEAAQTAAEAAAGSLTAVEVQINAASDAAFADADLLTARQDSGGALIKRSWTNIKSAVFTALGPLIAAAAAKATVVDADGILVTDSAAAGANKLTTFTQLWTNYLKAKADAAYLSITDPSVTGTLLEDIYTITDGAAFEVDPGNGSVQLITLTASRTPKATNFANGEAITLMIADGTAYTITWTDSTWGGSGVVWAGGSAPTLATTGYTVVELWKVGGQVYGAITGDVA
jgi:hypothetical protein